ncbi:unnamed protein product [Ectocarpus sp. 4 AP-2014]
MAMIGSLAQGLVGVIVDEVAAQGGRQMQQQRERGASFQHQQHQQQQQHDGQFQPQQQYIQQRRQQYQQQLPPGPLASLVESMTMIVNRAVAAAVTALQYLLLFEVVLLSAVVLYGALYWLVMPLRLHDKPIFLDYSDRAMTGGATGTVDFLARHTQWDPSPLTNVERLNTKVLKAGQHYKVGLELQMPTSYINRRIGVFMVHTTLLDEQGNELASSARPAMLPHTSALRKGMGMMFAWPLHLAGLRREEETVYVDCLDFYEENALHPLTKARVTVSSGRVQFYSSSINITPQLNGLPWLMHDFFYSTLAAGVLFIASLELMLFGFCYVFFFVSLGESNKNDNSSDTGVTSHRVGTVPASRGNRNRTSSASPSVTGIPNNTGRLSSSLSAAVTASSGGTGRGYPTTETNGGRESPPAREEAATMPRDQDVFRDDEGLRRRAGVGGGRSGTVAGGGSTVEPATAAVSGSRREGSGSVSSASTENRDTVWMGRPTSSLPSWLQEAATAAAAASAKTKKQEAPTLPPGVQAYQRGTRYIVRGSRPAAVAGSSGSGGAAGGSDPGGELEAFALASWAALEGNTIEPRRERAECEGRGHGGVAAVVDATETMAQGVRVVGCESVSAERAAVDGDDVAGSGCSRPTSGFGGADATLVDTKRPAVSAAPESWRVLDLSESSVDARSDNKR